MQVNSGPNIQTQVEVLKQAENVQEQGITKLLEQNTQQLQQQEEAVENRQKESTSQLTGLGTGLDITA